MTWTGNRRRQRLPADWARLQRRVLIRDSWACQIKSPDCLRQATEVDHVVPGDDHRETNLRAVCKRCHAAKSSSEGVAAKARLRARSKRPPKRHPGDLS